MHVLNQRDYLDSFSNVTKIVRSQLISSVREVWKMYEERELCVDINIYIQLSFFSYLFDRNGPVADELLTTASKYQRNWKKHYQTLLHYNQYLSNLYYDYHIVNACRDIHYVTSETQSLWTNVIKTRIDKTQNDPLCRLCRKREETVNHIFNECSKLAQKEYKGRHDCVAKDVHWDLCRKYGFECTDKWYENKPDVVVENEEVQCSQSREPTIS